MDSINSRIKEEICYHTIDLLKDENLIDEYKKCNSVIKNIELLEITLKNNKIDDITIQNIINQYLLKLIPPGTKGNIRGIKFNTIVKKFIENLNLNKKEYDVCFEKHIDFFKTDEIPDWYIFNKTNKKIIVGMNQLDLWNGGQQINRGFKYLVDIQSKETNKKLLCVICNETQFKSTNNKRYKLFEIGYKNDTLCYLKNLKNIIFDFFNIKED